MNWKDEVPGLTAATVTALLHAVIHLVSLRSTEFGTLMQSGWLAATGVVFVATYLGYKAVADSEIVDGWFSDELVKAATTILLVAIVVGAAHYGTHTLMGDHEVFEATMTPAAGMAAAVTAGFTAWIGTRLKE